MSPDARLYRALATAAAGALPAALSLVAAYAIGPGFTSSLDTSRL